MARGAVCCTARTAASIRAERDPGCLVALSHACERRLGAELRSKLREQVGSGAMPPCSTGDGLGPQLPLDCGSSHQTASFSLCSEGYVLLL